MSANTSIGIDISSGSVSLILVSNALPTEMAFRHDSNMPLGDFDAAGDGLEMAGQYAPPYGGNGLAESTVNLGATYGFEIWETFSVEMLVGPQFPGMATMAGPYGPPYQTMIALSTADPSDAAGSMLHGDLPPNMDFFSAAATIRHDATTARDPASNASSLSTTDRALGSAAANRWAV